MKITVSQNLNKLTISALSSEASFVATGAPAEELEIAQIADPVLLTDTARISKLPSFQRDAIMKLYEFPERVVRYDGVSARWSPITYPGVWAPSIDTVLFAKAVRDFLVKSGRIKIIASCLEIGTGSGFLGKYVLEKKKSSGQELELLHLTDINKDAIKCAMDNIEEVRGKTLMYYTHTRRDAKLAVDRKYDLVIANPPYIPRPSAKKNNPYEGLTVYEEIVRNAEKMLRSDSIFMTMLSSTSKNFIKPELDKVFNLKTITRLRVPLKIPIVTAGFSSQSRSWMSYLVKNKFIEEDRTEKSGYRYWQTIEVVAGKLKS